MPWPVIGSNPVHVGVIWIQKSKENDKVLFKHLGEDTFSLREALSPGKSEIVEINFDPYKYPDADEIWVGMVQGTGNWFYKWGDSVLKLMDKRAISKQRLADIRIESTSLLKEANRLKNERLLLLNKINEASIGVQDKYRSHIALKDPDRGAALEVSKGDLLDIDLSIRNASSVAWPKGTEKPVNIGILWFKKGSNPTDYKQHITEERCFLPYTIPSGFSADIVCKIGKDVKPGQYEVWVGMVHEHVGWFFEKNDSVLNLNVTVR